MAKPKRHYHHQHNKILARRLKFLILGSIFVPGIVLVAFVFFGPKLGTLLSLVSVNRNGDNQNNLVKPSAPIFDNPPTAINNRKVNLNGFSDSGNTIKLFVNGPEQQTTIATNDGKFTFEEIDLINRRNTIFAKSVTSDGTESDKSATVYIQVDDTPPEISINEPEDGKVVKNLNERVIVKGEVSEKAIIRINDKLAIMRPDNSFEFNLGVKAGEVVIKVEAKDDAGNESTKEIKITYVKSSD